MRLGIIGAQGKMGKQIISLALQDTSIEFTLPLNTREKLQAKDTPSLDVIIDFSTKEALKENLILAQAKSCPIVIGTTGFEKEEIELLREASKKIPIFQAPNFSLGMAATLYVSKILSSLLQGFTSRIEETHHTQKKDAPSGSALALKTAIEKGNPHSTPSITSFRVGDVIGEHKVFFTSQEEDIILSHQATSRAVFAKGALTAAKFLVSQKPGLYDMDDLLPYLLENHPS
ncbi:MAG: dihydrodipicolinate reductase C-terminal domain-containing protein [Chlamydiota bacterium]